MALSPLRAAATRLTASLGSVGLQATTALLREMYGVVTDAISRVLPAALGNRMVEDHSRVAGSVADAEAVSEGDGAAVHPVLILEPQGTPAAIRRQAASVARCFAEGVSPIRNLATPPGLKLGDRFLLWYGAYVSPGGGLVLPPLWLALYGNPGEVWDKSRPSFISETRLCAQHLLPHVRQQLTLSPTLALASAVRTAEADSVAAFKRQGLNSIKDICSGQPGGLGTLKAVRRVGVIVQACSPADISGSPADITGSPADISDSS